MSKQVYILITSAVTLGGKVVAPSDEPIAVSEGLAKNLLDRGKAELAVDEGSEAAAAEAAAAEAAAAEEAKAAEAAAAAEASKAEPKPAAQPKATTAKAKK